MTGYVYRWTCAVNDKWYIGSHNGSNPKYTGSGLLFVRAVRKYDIENFVREILYLGSNYRAEEERILTLLDAAADPMSYNMKNQALGVALPGVLNPMHKSHGRVDSPETRAKKGWSRGIKRPDHSARMTGENNPAYGAFAHTHGLVSYAASNRGRTLSETYGADRAAEILAKRKANTIGNGSDYWESRTCPCGKTGRGPNMSRYHFTNCKKGEISA